MIPTREKCIELLKKYNLSDSKIKHSLLVENISLYISKLLNKKNMNIDLTIVSRAALLHDIGKEIKKSGKDHATIGAKLCINENIDLKICEIIKYHILEGILKEKLVSNEQKIVFYSDKICKNEVIGIDKRFEPWMKNNLSSKIIDAKNKTIELEKEILNKLNLTPQELYSLLKSEVET